MVEEVRYIALRKLLIPNGPGKVPASIRIQPGGIFVLDGDEGIRVDKLLRQGHIRVYEEPPMLKASPSKGIGGLDELPQEVNDVKK